MHQKRQQQLFHNVNCFTWNKFYWNRKSKSNLSKISNSNQKISRFEWSHLFTVPITYLAITTLVLDEPVKSSFCLIRSVAVASEANIWKETKTKIGFSLRHILPTLEVVRHWGLKSDLHSLLYILQFGLQSWGRVRCHFNGGGRIVNLPFKVFRRENNWQRLC